MSNAIECKSGNGKGKVYLHGPSGQIVLGDRVIPKNKAAAWRYATQSEIDAVEKLEADRKAAEEKSNAPAHQARVAEAKAQESMAAKKAEHKEWRIAADAKPQS